MPKCLICSQHFVGINQNQLYCSYNCKQMGRYKKKNCKNCGDSFETAHLESSFCSRRCTEIHSGRTVELKCNLCGKTIYLKKSHVEKSKSHFCSKQCANKSLENKVIMKCQYCDENYIVRNCEKNKRMYCSKKCSVMSGSHNIDKDILKDLYGTQGLTSREVGQILSIDKKIILDYLKKYNIKIKPDGYKNKERIKCKDGHLVRSYYERAVDNELYKSNIPHVYEPRLPFNKKYAADFLVGESVFIEIWGMLSIKSYAEKQQLKLEMYKQNNCKLLSLYPDDFKNVTQITQRIKALI